MSHITQSTSPQNREIQCTVVPRRCAKIGGACSIVGCTIAAGYYTVTTANIDKMSVCARASLSLLFTNCIFIPLYFARKTLIEETSTPEAHTTIYPCRASGERTKTVLKPYKGKCSLFTVSSEPEESGIEAPILPPAARWSIQEPPA